MLRLLPCTLLKVAITLVPIHDSLHNTVEIACAHSLIEVRNSDLAIVSLPIPVLVIILQLADLLLLLLNNVGQLYFQLVGEAAVVRANHRVLSF